MIVWIDSRFALAINERQLAEHGGSVGVRDGQLLESALAQPQQRYAHRDPAPDLAELAASLADGLVRNHPFVDCNKRTAAVACETFIELNAASLQADDLELYPIYMALAEGALSESDFAAWLRQRIALRPRAQFNEPRLRYRGVR
jgi:death-on-curing protein